MLPVGFHDPLHDGVLCWLCRHLQMQQPDSLTVFWGDGAVKSGKENGSCETQEAAKVTLWSCGGISAHFTQCKRTLKQGKETMEINNFVAKLLVAF